MKQMKKHQWSLELQQSIFSSIRLDYNIITSMLLDGFIVELGFEIRYFFSAFGSQIIKA